MTEEITNQPQAQPPMQPVSAPAPSGPILPDAGVIALYGYAWKRLWKNFPMLLVVMLIYTLMCLPVFIPIFGSIYEVFVLSVLQLGTTYVMIKAGRNEAISVNDLFRGFSNYWNAILVTLLVGLIILGGLILLIVPGIIFGCKLVFATYLVVDRKMGAIEAIKTSWSMTTGHAWTIFLVGLLAIPICITGLICLIVGLLPASFLCGLALSALYYAISSNTLKAQTEIVNRQ